MGHAFNNSRNEKARRNLCVQLIGLGLERGRLVAFGDVGGVEGAFGVDAFGAVLFSGGRRVGIITPRSPDGRYPVGAVGNSPVGRHRAGNSSRLPRQPARRRGGLGAGALADGGYHRGVGQLGIEHTFEA